MKKVIVVIAAIIVIALVAAGCGSKKQTANVAQSKAVDYPKKTIKLVNFMPALNIGPDQWTRKVASLMEKRLGQKFEIVNVPEDGGAKGAKQVWAAPHDGYTVLGETENMLGFGVNGQTKQITKDWTFFEIAQVKSILAVKSDSPYKTVEDLVNTAKANQGKIKVGNTGLGRTHHLKTTVIEKVTGAKFTHVPYPGGVGAGDALLKGDIDAISIPIPAITKEIKEGKIRPLALMDLGTVSLDGADGTVESIVNYYPGTREYLPIDGVTGFAMPADTPKEVIVAFGKAFEEAMESPEMTSYLQQQGLTRINLWGDSARSYMGEMESNLSWRLNELGLAKVDPQSIGIPKPKRVK